MSPTRKLVLVHVINFKRHVGVVGILKILLLPNWLFDLLTNDIREAILSSFLTFHDFLCLFQKTIVK